MKALPLFGKFHLLPHGCPLDIQLPGGEQLRLRLKSIRSVPGGYGITLDGVANPEDARPLRGALVAVSREMLELGAAEYWSEDIIGLDVFTDAGTGLGKVVEILSTGSNDVYVVRAGDNEVLVPAIRDVVLEVRIEEGKMIIHPMEGMLD